jgi:hypothetical protein
MAPKRAAAKRSSDDQIRFELLANAGDLIDRTAGDTALAHRDLVPSADLASELMQARLRILEN